MPSLLLDVLFSLKTHGIQEKFIAKLVNSIVNLAGITDIALIASSFMRCWFLGVKFTVERTSLIGNDFLSIEESKEKN